jgi:ribosomal protein L3 glutamine methyltransferase
VVNVGQCIQQVSATLESSGLHFGHGTDNSGDEAAWLVLHVLNAPLDGSFVDWERELDPAEETRVAVVLADRVNRALPLAYVLGSAWFAGLEFHVNDAVLVPRSPIAELILEHFQPWAGDLAIHRVLDLCAGSGCIGIAIAHYMPWVRVDAADISMAALEVAQGNIDLHGLRSRVQLYESDLYSGLCGKKYDLIVTNPPYVAEATMRTLPREYLAEPELGLVSGGDGLDACLQIMVGAGEHLSESGLLICEVGESAETLAGLLPSVPFVWPEFSHGGSGVFILSRQEVLQSMPAVLDVIKDRKHVA